MIKLKRVLNIFFAVDPLLLLLSGYIALVVGSYCLSLTRNGQKHSAVRQELHETNFVRFGGVK